MPTAVQNPIITIVDKTSLKVSWDSLTTDASMGYSAITLYTVTGDNGLGGAFSDLGTTTDLNKTFTSLTTGTTY